MVNLCVVLGCKLPTVRFLFVSCSMGCQLDVCAIKNCMKTLYFGLSFFNLSCHREVVRSERLNEHCEQSKSNARAELSILFLWKLVLSEHEHGYQGLSTLSTQYSVCSSPRLRHKATSSIGVSRELLTKRLLASCSQNAFLEYRGFERAAHKTTSSMGVSSELLTKRLRVSGFRASCSQNAFLEYRGFDPRASRMQSERSTN
jgi:hypothetical protein